MYETILVGTDGSDEAHAALSHALDLARAVDATVHVLTVVDPRSNPLRFGVIEVDELNRAMSDLVDDIVEEVNEPDVDLVGDVRRGNPVEVILEAAEDVDADVLVVGQHGADRFSSAVIGSTSARLAQLSSIPLTIVPTNASE